MSKLSVDETDRRILYLLQRDARCKITDIAAAVDVSGNTVRNRISSLEERGVIKGYSADLDYKEMGLDLHFLFDCSARVGERTELTEKALEIPGIVEARELMTGKDNIRVEGVGSDTEDITRVAEAIDALGLIIEREALVRNDFTQPLSALECDDGTSEG